LSRLYDSVRLFVNYFQPSFKLAEKQRDGAQVRKRYHKRQTPYQRLLDVREPRRKSVFKSLQFARPSIQSGSCMIFGPASRSLSKSPTRQPQRKQKSICPPTIDQFSRQLKTAWREGEANPTAKPKAKISTFAPTTRIRWHRSISRLKAGLRGTLRTAREFLDRLQAEIHSLSRRSPSYAAATAKSSAAESSPKSRPLVDQPSQ